MPLNAKDRERLDGLVAFARDASLLELVHAHVGACMAELPRSVRVKGVHVTAQQRDSVVSSVQVKLSNGGVIVIDVGQLYTTRSVTMLSGYEPPAPERWYVYVVRCADDTLYCGTTNDVTRRVTEHNTSARGAKYTRARRPVTLVKSWPAGTRSDAVKAETRFKKLPKQEKERVVTEATVPRQPT
jgi:putative endonuclease